MSDGATGDLGDGSVDGVGVTAVDDDAKALGRKQFRDREPDAAGAADDDGTAARELGQLFSACSIFMASPCQ